MKEEDICGKKGFCDDSRGSHGGRSVGFYKKMGVALGQDDSGIKLIHDEREGDCDNDVAEMDDVRLLPRW